MLRPARHTLAVILLALASVAVPPATVQAAAVASDGTINGVVTHEKTKAKIPNAVVILECTCLQGTRETTTNANGLYAFRDLPPGDYTITILSGQAKSTKRVELPRGAKFRANFSVDPKKDFKRVVRVKANPVAQETSVGRTVSMEEFRNIPVGNSSGRDFTSVVESSASASRDSAGITLGGTTSSVRVANEPFNREGYEHITSNDFLTSADRPMSTFSVDVDTASYANVRRFITQGSLPPPGAVRIEELINYFDYDYQAPKGEKPVTVNWEIAECPWNDANLLARIGLQTKHIDSEETPPRNLVFLLDVSGSMNQADKLPLLKSGMQLLVDNLREQDTVSIVVYAGSAGTVLPPTPGDEKIDIRNAIAALGAGGSTNGAGGIRLAYDLAQRHFVKGGVNRVILGTDGDFNVGTSSNDELVDLIEKKRETGVFLSVLGFGTGNLQDHKMELLADKGNGNYAYIDSMEEAQKVLVEEAGSTLVTVAKDVKLQVEFNPAKVASYRLVGYENRLLADEDFEDDKKDAGEMGAGHSVTALYEIVPTSDEPPPRRVRKLRYQTGRTPTSHAATDEWMTVAIRYKRPDGDRSRLLEVPMRGRPNPVAKASTDFRFAAAVAAYGMELRGSPHKGKTSLGMVKRLASGARGRDLNGYRAEFIDLVGRTRHVERRD